MWIEKHSDFFYSNYVFTLEDKEVASFEQNFDFNGSYIYYGYVLDKNGSAYSIMDQSMAALSFKIIVKLKSLGWDIDGFPIVK